MRTFKLSKQKLSTLEKKLDKIFSEYVRRKNADHIGLVRCCTCNKIDHWKNMHLGHFMSRRYKSTRLHENNVDVQCPGCNTFNQGRQFEMAKHLDEKHGHGTADLMLQMSKMICKRDRYDLEVLIEEYKTKLKYLKN